MEDDPYGISSKKTPPSLVTVENGFTFQGEMDDSDLSSLNTTPRKQEQRKSILTRGRLSPDQIDQADLGLLLSKANRNPHSKRVNNNPRRSGNHSWNHRATHEEEEEGNRANTDTTMEDPPLQVVQVGDRSSRMDGDSRVAKEEENNLATISSRGRSRDEKLRDRKEKYRSMTAPSSARRGGNKLHSWKKQADERKEKAQKERVKPWFVPALNEDEVMGRQEDGVSMRQDEDDDTDISPMKATKHTFEEDDDEDEPTTEEVIRATEYKPKAPEKKKDNDTAIVASKNKFSVERSESPTMNVDMYGCPIFNVDSDEEELQETKAKLDQLDTSVDEKEEEVSIKAMLSSASFFSKSAAQTLAEPAGGLGKFLGDAAVGVEALVLGPLEEGDEEEKEEEDENSSQDTPPPPPPRRRGRSPTAAVDATNSAEKRISIPPQQEDSVAESASFVLDDKSEVDVPAVLEITNVTPHFVLSDLAAMEKLNEANDTLAKGTNEQVVVDEQVDVDEEEADIMNNVVQPEADEKAVDKDEPGVKAEVVDPEPDVKAVDESTDSDLFVEDEKITSIEDEIDAAVEVMDAIHVKDEVERLETIHAAQAASKSLTVPAVADSAEGTPEDEVVEEAVPKEEEEVSGPVPLDESESAKAVPIVESESAKAVPLDATPEAASPEEESESALVEESSEEDSLNESSELLPPYQASSEALTPGQASEAALSDGVPATPDKNAPDNSASDDDESAQSGRVAAAVAAGVVGAAVVTVAVTPDENEIERDPGQLVIAAPNGHNEAEEPREEEEEPEFPPTDDADVDRIDFDTISVKSDGTPVRANLDDSKEEERKKEKEVEKEPAKKEEAPAAPVPLETAPETPEAKVTRKKSKRDTASVRNKRSPQAVASPSSSDASAPKPAMVKTLDDNNGIAKGDIVLSLLNTNLSEANRAPKGSDQVRDAILRMRDMRKRQEKVELPEKEEEEFVVSPSGDPESPSKRSALPVDVDDMRVVGAFDHVKELEEDAIEHLKHDEFEAALELYEEIVAIYAEAFKETAKKRKKKDKNDHKAYIGAALHNIGILNLLRFDFEEALSFFEKAADNRKDHFGEGTVDHLASLGKIALCHYAMDEYETAHKSLEQVLELSKNHLAGLTDFMQVAEVLNNLGCLSFMCGQSGSAMTMFKECLDIQTSVLKQSLYSGPKYAGQSTSLNISVTRGNIGYVQMLTKNAGPAIVEFEASLMHQQMILNDAHDTLVCTMDHLAVANLLAKNKEEAIKMLGRMLRAQLAAYGALDERCILTLSKLQLVQTEQTDYLEKALEQLWDQHSTSASPSAKAASVATAKKSNKMMKKLSFRKKAAKLNN